MAAHCPEQGIHGTHGARRWHQQIWQVDSVGRWGKWSEKTIAWWHTGFGQRRGGEFTVDGPSMAVLSGGGATTTVAWYGGRWHRRLDRGAVWDLGEACRPRGGAKRGCPWRGAPGGRRSLLSTLDSSVTPHGGGCLGTWPA
jgi:hypothetical protein